MDDAKRAENVDHTWPRLWRRRMSVPAADLDTGSKKRLQEHECPQNEQNSNSKRRPENRKRPRNRQHDTGYSYYCSIYSQPISISNQISCSYSLPGPAYFDQCISNSNNQIIRLYEQSASNTAPITSNEDLKTKCIKTYDQQDSQLEDYVDETPESAAPVASETCVYPLSENETPPGKRRRKRSTNSTPEGQEQGNKKRRCRRVLDHGPAGESYNEPNIQLEPDSEISEPLGPLDTRPTTYMSVMSDNEKSVRRRRRKRSSKKRIKALQSLEERTLQGLSNDPVLVARERFHLASVNVLCCGLHRLRLEQHTDGTNVGEKRKSEFNNSEAKRSRLDDSVDACLDIKHLCIT